MAIPPSSSTYQLHSLLPSSTFVFYSRNRESDLLTKSKSQLWIFFLKYLSSLTLSARPMKAGLPANPRQMAHTMLDFPVPLAPIIIFRWGPGETSQISYVLNYREVKLLRHKNVFFAKTFISADVFYRFPWIALKASWPYILMLFIHY